VASKNRAEGAKSEFFRKSPGKLTKTVNIAGPNAILVGAISGEDPIFF
jgi:hypothetical protein